jgi:uncharacterized protein YjbI with pentapeptide repeats
MISELKGRAIVANKPLHKHWKNFSHTSRRYTSHLWRFPETRKLLVQVVLRRPLFIVKWLFIIVGIIVLPFILVRVIILGYNLPITGFNGRPVPEYQPAKTLWDWLQLLIIPAVLVVIGTIFNRLFDKRSRDIASDQQQETALQDYLKGMSELLITDHLGESGTKSSLKDIARARTLIVLHGLDPLRKGRILRFLYETGLITDKDKPIVDLCGANFSNLKIHETKLNSKYLHMTGTRISLRNAKLQGAIFRDASLEQVDLCGACLDNAYSSNIDLNMTWLCNNASMKMARLNGSNLYRACLREAQMQQVQLRGAFLREADLRRANLQKADLQAAHLQQAHLEEACLQGADLREADLRGAHLQGADLREADLRGAHLQGAKLCGTNLTEEQRTIASGAKFENCEDVPHTHDHNWQLVNKAKSGQVLRSRVINQREE